MKLHFFKLHTFISFKLLNFLLEFSDYPNSFYYSFFGKTRIIYILFTYVFIYLFINLFTYLFIYSVGISLPIATKDLGSSDKYLFTNFIK